MVRFASLSPGILAVLCIALPSASPRAELIQTRYPEGREADRDGATPPDVAGASDGSDEIQDGPPRPQKRPPDGLLPVGEVARLGYAPRDKPRVLLYGYHLLVVGHSGFVEGYDAATGTFVWKLGLPGEALFDPVIFEAGPLVEGETDVLTVILSEPSGRVLLVDGLTGNIQREMQVPVELALPPLRGPEDLVFFATPSGDVGAYDVGRAEVVFQTATGEPPLALASAPSVLLVSGGSQTLTAVDLPGGGVRWRFRGRAAFHAPAAFDDEATRVYIGDDSGELYCLDAGTGSVEFRWATGAAIRTPALVEGERLYLTSFANTLFAYHAKSGDEHWRANLPGRPATGPIRIQNRLLVATFDGTLVEVNPRRGQPGKRYTAPGEILEPPAWFLARPSAEELVVEEERAAVEDDTETQGAEDGLDPDVFGPEELDGAPAAPAEVPAEAPEEVTAEESEAEDAARLDLPDEPAWFERSRIAMTLRSGEVVLLAHSAPEPKPAATDDTDEAEVDGEAAADDEDARPPRPPTH